MNWHFAVEGSSLCAVVLEMVCYQGPFIGQFHARHQSSVASFNWSTTARIAPSNKLRPRIATDGCPAQICPDEASQFFTCCKREMSYLPAIAQCMQTAAKAWSMVQVELHGQYSLERMRRLHVYSTTTSWARILFWCIITPIPCLLANISLDFAPLTKPSAGREANYVFWVRGSVVTFIITYVILMQVSFLTPGLGMAHRHLSWMTLAAVVGCITYGYFLAGLIPMPVPFLFLASTPVFFTTFAVMFAILFGRKLRNGAGVREASIRAIGVMSIEFSLTFIYPVFIYGFNSIPPKYQTPYMALIPVIKITAKNIMSKFVISDDMRPETLVFCIDTFHAVYVSLAMQKATTISTSLTIMLIDIAQACLSVYDVYEEFQPLKRFMNTIPAGHPLHGKNFLEVAIALDQRGQTSTARAERGQHVKRTSLSLGVLGSSTIASVRVLPETPFREHAPDPTSVAALPISDPKKIVKGFYCRRGNCYSRQSL